MARQPGPRGFLPVDGPDVCSASSMNEYRESVGGRVVLVSCDSRLEPSVGLLFDRLRGLGSRPRHGLSIDFGWSPVVFREGAGTLVASEPDFVGDPMARLVDGVTTTLGVLALQVGLHRWIGVDAVDTRFNDLVVLTKGVPRKPRLYLERDDDGWFIGEAGAPEPTQHQIEALPASVLRRHRRTAGQPPRSPRRRRDLRSRRSGTSGTSGSAGGSSSATSFPSASGRASATPSPGPRSLP